MELNKEKQKVIDICETKFWEALSQGASRLNTLEGRERENKLKEMKFLSETLKFIYSIPAEILDVKPDKSFTITIKFQYAYHLKEFMMNLDKLKDCLMKDLKQLPVCQKYDLKDTYIEVKVNEDLREIEQGKYPNVPASAPAC